MTRGAKRLSWVAATFLLISLLTRIGLALFSSGTYTVAEWGRFLSVGVVFDLTILPWFLVPWAIYDAAMPEFTDDHRLFKWENRWASVWGAMFLTGFVVTAASEFVFWGEFGNRFDFIAVDYLIYTHEVIGNIRESYPLNLWLSVIFGLCLAVCWFTWPRSGDTNRASRPVRWGRAALVALAIGVGFFSIDQNLADTKSNAQVAQLSSNGIFAFGHAFRNNQLEYDKYYPRLNATELNTEIRKLVEQRNARFTGAEGIKRKFTAHGPLRNTNVVLISVESLSADYMGKFGNQLGITPELDKLSDQGLLFTNLYATGTRTVRGLEALSIGTPPIPGQSIVRRPKNSGMETLGGELKENGWVPYWIYGGYGLFDNMNAYFGGNGYKIVDRTDVDTEAFPVHAENIWGIADEDLFTMAISNIDREYASGNRFFTQIMTTSNHRPYTFPENRIDLPQKKRESAVKYTDWAIGDFIKRSAKKPWFDNTLFIIIADHTAKAAGKTDLPPWRYHIPMIWYGPKLVKPALMDRLMSQVDVGPTLLGWLGLGQSGSFYGYDMFNLEPGRERAFISTYQKLGYLKGNRLVVLDVNKDPVVLAGLPKADSPPETQGAPSTTQTPSDQDLIKEATAWYQSASQYFRTGKLKADINRDEK